MPSRVGCSVVVVAALALATGCSSGKKNAEAEFTVQKVDGLTLPARVEGRSLDAATKNGFVGAFWPGVNLGSTTPGHDPGEVAIARSDVARWLPEMAGVGVRVVRIYTILPPAFYDALRSYDLAHPEAPIYFIQGVWIPEQQFLDTGNAYDPAVTQGFRAELRDAVAVVHGHATSRRGRVMPTAATGATSRPGCWPGRSASSGIPSRHGRPIASTRAPRRSTAATSARAPMPRRWRAGWPGCSTTRQGSRRRAAGAGR